MYDIAIFYKRKKLFKNDIFCVVSNLLKNKNYKKKEYNLVDSPKSYLYLVAIVNITEVTGSNISLCKSERGFYVENLFTQN